MEKFRDLKDYAMTDEDIKKNIIVGYSFKGGVGRSQTLAYISILLSMLGKKIVVLDCDFEAPGISDLLTKNPLHRRSQGILDYFIDKSKIEDEIKRNEIDLKKYYYKHIPSIKIEKKIGRVKIFQTGIRDNSKEYMEKLSKFDFTDVKFYEELKEFIIKIKKEIKPDYILLDLHSGINDLNKKILQEFYEKRLLFFGGDNQNKIGMDIILGNLEDKETYIVNSLIRYDAKIANKKLVEFKKYIGEHFPNYKDKIIKLEYVQNFLNADLEGLEEEAKRNIPALLSENDEIKDAALLSELFQKLKLLYRSDDKKMKNKRLRKGNLNQLKLNY